MRAARRAVGFGADRATDRASAFVDNPPILGGRIYHCTPEARICDRAVPCGASAGVADQAGKPKGCVAVVNEERAVSAERGGRPSTADRRQRAPPRGAPGGPGRFGGGLPVVLGEARVGRRWPLCGARGGSGGSAVASLPGSGSLGRVGGLRRGRLPAGAWGRSAVWPCEAGDAWAGAPAGPEKAGVSRRASAGSPRLSSGYPGRGPGEPGVCLGSSASGGGSGKARASSGHPPAAAGGEPGPGRTRAQGRGPSPGSGADYCALHGDA
ncbi:hypothetical protein JOF35_005680 [Streptomyces demainii]|uniref:Uncharacterized protein n=1 Tax=Streptomyces demainii TaxID=588122 RepID=A0ABT9L0T1_9ACTN|nr:hypothetical protein [Streptomyces demainii]